MASGPNFALENLGTTWIVSGQEFLVSKLDHYHHRTDAFVTETKGLYAMKSSGMTLVAKKKPKQKKPKSQNITFPFPLPSSD